MINLVISNPFKHMRNRFYVATLLENSINTIANPGGIVMTGLFLYLNLNESQIATLLSLVGLSTLLQIFSTLIYQKLPNKKSVILSLYGLRSFALFLIGLVPFFTNSNLYYPLLLILTMLRLTFMHLVGGGLMEWTDSHVPEAIKGRYFGRRNAMLNAAFIFITLFIGVMLDHYSPSAPLYLTFFLITVLLYLLEFFVLIRIPIIKKSSKKQLNLKDIFVMPLSDSAYRSFMIFSILWVFALSFGRPLLNVYAVKYMNYSYKLIATVGSLTAFIKIFSGVTFGHLIDSKGVNFVIKTTGIGFAIFSFAFVFLTPGNPLIYIIATIGLGIFMIGFNVSKVRLNIQLSTGEHMNVFLSANSFFVGIATFVSLYISGHIIRLLSGLTIDLIVIQVNSYQLLFLISGGLHLIAIYYFVKSQKKGHENGKIQSTSLS